MTVAELNPDALARALYDVIVERYAASSGGGYYTFAEKVEPEDEPDLTDLGLDGKDDLVSICTEALRRLRP